MFSSNASQVSDANYIEDVFSTYLYTGNGSTQTITNGINLSGKGGLIWNKCRSDGGTAHWLWDTDRGGSKCLTTSGDTSNFGGTGTNASTNFWSPTPSTTGYSFSGSNPTGNANASTYTSWTFRKQPKFFDVVTYTGNGINGTAIPHNLGSVPGCIIIKRTDTTGDWYVYHRSYNGGVNPEQYTTYLNLTNAVAGPGSYSQYQAPTSTAFYPGGAVNAVGGSATYVAYLFAHDAGGFGASGTDNVISCGSFTKSASVEATITLGYEPQWLLFKRTDAAENWFMIDNMRGMPVGGTDAYLIPNLSSAENNLDFVTPTATGFIATNNFNTGTYIYIAIRRGPMKTPTSGTSVFSPQIWTGNGTNRTITSGGIPPDLFIAARRTTPFTAANAWWNKLAGQAKYLVSQQTGAEQTTSDSLNTASNAFLQDGIALGANATQSNTNYATSSTYVGWFMRRAPGFFDVVCYTGDGASTKTVTHNLGVSPELIIAKKRSSVGDWGVYVAGQIDGALLNTTDGFNVSNRFTSVGATSFAVRLSGTPSLNDSGATYVAYPFATCPGVSKVGTYTGNGTNQTINCGFTSGARFILIKRTDSTGDWYVWDTARGIGGFSNDPHLSLNTTAAEVTTDDSIQPASSGFLVVQNTATNINVNAASYIFLAIA